MARDEGARERTEEPSRLGRRKYLRALGATAVSAAALGGSATAATDYRTIEVPAGSTRTFSLGDGDTLENTLIDATATGASYRIHAAGDDWTIRNVGARGSTLGDEHFIVYTNGGSATIENVYLGDGGPNTLSDGGLPTGIYVAARHSGDLLLRNVNVQGFSGNGLYGSNPGNHSNHPNVGQGGTVRVEDSYFADNGIADVRLGSDGSYARNCVMMSTKHRGYWGYYENTTLENCDVAGRAVAGESSWNTNSTVELSDTRLGGSTVTATSDDQFVGSSAGHPDDRIPDGVPTTPAEAASGASGGNDGGSDDGTTTDPGDGEGDDEDANGTLLELVAAPDASNAEYEFTVEGGVSKRTDPSGSNQIVAEDNDTVTDNGDGTATVSGLSGNGLGDAFYVEGEIVSMDLNEDEWTIRYDGEEVAVSDLVLPKKLVIDGNNRPRAATTYTFEVSGTARKSGALGSVNAYDEISDGEISGRVVGGKDGYRFSGDITGFSIDGPARVHVEDDQ